VPSAHSEPEVPETKDKTPEQMMAEARNTVKNLFHPEKED
jgi:hypothetical protein